MGREWWTKSFFVTTAVGVGAWVPIRALYFHDLYAVDAFVDLATLLLVALHYGFKAKDSGDGEPKNYLDRFSILSDILVALPLTFILHPFFGAATSSLMLIKLLLLKRLSYIRHLLDAFDSLHPVAFRLIPLAIFMPMLVHLVACGWIWLGSGTAGPDPDPITEYAKALYWTFTTLTTVGYGDISAKTIPQMMYAASAQVIGVAVFGFVLSNVASLLARIDAAREHHMSILDRVETYMRYNRMSPALRGRVRAYYRYMWETHHGYDDSEVLNTLPPKLRSEVALFMNKEIIEKVPLLKGASDDLVQDIVLKFKPMVCVPEEKIFHANEPGNAMYFIHSGKVEIVGKESQIFATLGPGKFFGEMALITSNPRSATARAATYCDLFVLAREDFETVVHRYPEFQIQLDKIVQERQAANTQKAG